MGKKLTTEQFIQRAVKIHGNKYDYSEVIYNGMLNPIKIKCNCGNIFFKTPKKHLHILSTCPKCSKRQIPSTDEFIKKAQNIHGDLYDYTNVKYINNKTHILLKCNGCLNSFKTTPNMHIQQKCGCPSCYGNNQITKKDFIKKFINIHGSEFKFDKLEVQKANDIIIIYCNTHGYYNTTQKKSLYLKNGCPNCSESRGEKMVRLFLEKNNLTFQREYIIKSLGNYRFDFFIPSKNTIIEFDGKQHFQPIPFFGGIRALRKTKHNDYIKTMYCINNHINIIRIKYTDILNISDILSELSN